MGNILTDWRKTVIAHLDANLQAGAWKGRVKSGERDGGVREKKLCHVFAPPIRTDGGNVNFARPVLLVRCWLPTPRTPRAPNPRDPEPIEQLMIDLAITLEQIQVLPAVAGGDGLYFIVTEIRPDYDEWGVQATLTGWARNPATTSE